MTTPMAARPIQPSIRKQLAQFLALMDPRCGLDAHNRVAQGETCPHCGLNLWTYADVIPQDWP
jgi:hypothetical protein